MRILRSVLPAVAALCLLADPISAKDYINALYVTDSDYSPCHYDCAPFNVVYFYFCFDTGDRVLVGQKYAWKWEYDPSLMHALRGQTVRLRYDDKYIWVIRTDGKEMKLKQAYGRDNRFTSGKCADAVKLLPQK